MSAPRLNGTSRWLTAALLLMSLPLLGMNREQFRFSRAVVASPGWSVLDLPDDVLAQSKPDLSDLRLMTASGELAYEREKQLTPSTLRIPLLDVERVPNKETSALVDRGEHSEPCSQLTLEVSGSEPFLKPVILEASDDRAMYRELVRGSLFRVAGGVMTTLSFPVNSRRYLRIRLSDRESEPVNPEAVLIERPATAPVLRTVPLSITHLATSSTSEDTYSLHLPSEHLPVVALQLGTAEPVFSRAVRVYERVLFRDHPTRRPISVGQIARGANGKETLSVPLSAISEVNFEIDVERAGSPLLLSDASVSVTPQRIVFLAPKTGDIELVYGSVHADVPRYDLQAAFALGMPERLATASLGAARDRGAPPAAPPVAPTRGGVLDAARWQRRAPIVLPQDGSVAYLDLGAEIDHSVRIIDRQGRQVPYVTESSSQYEIRNATLSAHSDGTRTITTLSGHNLQERVVGIQLHASEPDYFSRPIAVYEAISDARAVIGRRPLGSGFWERQPGDGDLPFHLDIDSPTQPSITLEVDNGDNSALHIASATFQIERRRIDFVFDANEPLTLLYDNPAIGDPSYDLRLLGATLVASPARAARLGASEDRSPVASPSPSKWLFIAVIASGALVLLALLRTLRSEDKGDPNGKAGRP